MKEEIEEAAVRMNPGERCSILLASERLMDDLSNRPPFSRFFLFLNLSPTDFPGDREREREKKSQVPVT